jgi:membrane protease YdiL (CAAX protease family)
MRTWIQSLSTNAEALIVCAVAFGPSLFGVFLILVGALPAPSISQEHIDRLLVFEPLVLMLLGAFLHLRGWTAQRIGFLPGWNDTLIGVGLALAAYVAYAVLWYASWFAHFGPTYLAGSTALVHGRLSLLSVATVSLVNPLFEEIFVCGYLVTLGRESKHLTAGTNASIGLRLAYHLYQGGAGVIGILPFGFLMALWYSRSRRLWPVVIAHAVTDFAGLAPFIGQ